MKLLIVTQVVDVDHPILGFFHRWVEEFAVHCEHVHVICLQAGKHSLPANVTTHSLGKEYGYNRFKHIWLFYRYIWRLRHEYDSVFIHMNQVYVLLGAPLWKLWKKRVGLWYVHRQVTTSLRLAVALVDRVFSSVPQSMRVKTSKVSFVGHGIDLARYQVQRSQSDAVFRIVHIGRITSIKNIDTLVDAAAQLQSKTTFEIHLYGEPVTNDDLVYKQKLQEQIKRLALQDVITFCGSVGNNEIPPVLATADLSVNLTPPGGLDKAVIESAAAGVPVITSNTSYASYYGDLCNSYVCELRNSADLVYKITQHMSLSQIEKEKTSNTFRNISEQFSVQTIIPKILEEL